MSVLDMSGRAVERSPEPLLIKALQALLDEIRDDPTSVQAFYLIVERADPSDSSRVIRCAVDSGMTVAEAVFRLEMEKATVLNMVLGLV